MLDLLNMFGNTRWKREERHKIRRQICESTRDESNTLPLLDKYILFQLANQDSSFSINHGFIVTVLVNGNLSYSYNELLFSGD